MTRKHVLHCGQVSVALLIGTLWSNNVDALHRAISCDIVSKLALDMGVLEHVLQTHCHSKFTLSGICSSRHSTVPQSSAGTM